MEELITLSATAQRPVFQGMGVKENEQTAGCGDRAVSWEGGSWPLSKGQTHLGGFFLGLEKTQELSDM